MARRKKKRVGAVKKTRNASSEYQHAAERKQQRQYYVTQAQIDGLEELRAAKEAELRKQLGTHIDLTTSQFIGSVIHDLIRAKKAKAK